ncbi:hypothetical protein Pan216_43310 [Planctomycetes bacterium Pan216]|uniref:DUF423 domain-containing protein n=1 Tax=Kolteria novifilia TaxID=2527975 RepID=A0A518B908_9BACT|nr:hypothetical protein Pan216_43310 [Planctomycetes bacterium Pan216]
MERFWIVAGALLGGFGVMAGAFGAHLLKDQLTPERLDVFEVAVRYQMYHALALVGVGIATAIWSSSALQVAGWSFLGGTVIFSGTLYLLVLSGMKWLGAITPLGGLGLMVGWGALVVAALTMTARTP